MEQKITVLSPRGKPPVIQLQPMAPRLNTLDGKTVYLVNDGIVGTDILLGENDGLVQGRHAQGQCCL